MAPDYAMLAYLLNIITRLPWSATTKGGPAGDGER
jgi:hypothetical protein